MPACGATHAKVGGVPVGARAASNAAASPPPAPISVRVLVDDRGAAGWARLDVVPTRSTVRALRHAIASAVGITAPASKINVRLVPKVAGAEPTAAELAAAVPLKPTASLAAAGIAEGAWMLVSAPDAAATTPREPSQPSTVHSPQTPSPSPLPSSLPAGSNYYVRFVSALLAKGAAAAVTQTKVDGGGTLLQLSDGLLWPGIQSPVLFVRYFYDDLYTHVLRRCRYDPSLPKQNLFTLHGTPGIGKSAMGWYFIWRLLQEPDRPDIAYVNESQMDGVLLPSRGRPRPLNPAFMPLNRVAQGGVMICDSMAPPTGGRFAIAISATRRTLEDKALDELPKYGIQLCVPPWRLDELEALNEVTAKLPRALVQERYRLWGGSARYVFSFAAPISGVLTRLQRTRAVEVAAMVDAHGQTKVPSSDTFQHLFPRGSLDGSGLSTAQMEYYLEENGLPASEILHAVLVQKLDQRASVDTMKLLLGGPLTTAMGALRGNVLESVLPRLAAHGFDLTLRLLPSAPAGTGGSSAIVKTVKVLAAETVEFTSMTHLQELVRANPRRHFRPKTPTLAAVDMVLAVEAGPGGSAVTHVPVQATVAAGHGIKVGSSRATSGLRGMTSVFPWSAGSATPFVFLLPQDVLSRDADAWSTAQPIKVSDSPKADDDTQQATAVTERQAFFSARFQQYVAGVSRTELMRGMLQLPPNAHPDPLSALRAAVNAAYPTGW